VLVRQAQALQDALSELVRAYQFRDRDRICCHDISVTQCHALDRLVREGPCSLGELAASLYLDKSTASRVASTLERKGYVTRGDHPEDGRAVVLRATAAGRRLRQRILRDLVAEKVRLLEDFEPEVRESAPQLLHSLARAVSRRAEAAPPDAACCGSLAPGEACEKPSRERGSGS
jgi:DNA-binding MarR family transcriptional regulator